MKHPRFTAWLCSAAALVLLAVPAFAQQPDALPPEQTAPAAQAPDFKYTEAAIGIDAAPNFEGYPEQCYVSLVGKGLGLDRQHAINLGLPGLTTGDLADMLHTGAMPQMNQQAGTYYVYPQMLDYLKRADRLQRCAGARPCGAGQRHQLEERAAGSHHGQRRAARAQL